MLVFLVISTLLARTFSANGAEQTAITDLVKAEATLAEVKDPAVKLPLHVGLIKIDPFGQGKPISAAFLFERTAQGAPRYALSICSKPAGDQTCLVGLRQGRCPGPIGGAGDRRDAE